MSKTILLEELEIYQLAMQIGEEVWEIVLRWDTFPKRTLGAQLIRAVDSIAANIAEGYGRYFYKDRKQFCYYSRGSLMETKSWATKAFNRRLLDKEEMEKIIERLGMLHLRLNVYIKTLKRNSVNPISQSPISQSPIS